MLYHQKVLCNRIDVRMKIEALEGEPFYIPVFEKDSALGPPKYYTIENKEFQQLLSEEMERENNVASQHP